ncbi:MAG: hypothetical protein HY913_05155 [Desulfomonile tiedjei]|nr:hypothetical protein [Desulfomonile tiedjei]
MRTFYAIIAMVALIGIGATAASADEYFVIRDRDGRVAVTSESPGYGWSVVQGPFATPDEATRAAGKGTEIAASPVFPQTMSKNLERNFYVIRDRDGQTVVTSDKPAYGWSRAQGPFASRDEAIRAMGSGTEFPLRTTFPQTLGEVKAHQYFVWQNRDGQIAVTSEMPNYGWNKVQGPFASRDEAVRASGSTLSFSQVPSSAR